MTSEVADNNGRRIATEVSLFDAQTGGKPRAVGRGHKGDAAGLVYSRDGKRFATVSYSAAETVVWDADTLETRATMPTYGALAWSPDGQTLNVSGLRFWSAEGRHLFTLGRHGSQVWAVAADPKGRGFASAQNMPVIHFWDAASLKNTANATFDMGGRTMTRSVAYSADGGTLAIGYGNAVKLLDPASGRDKFTAEGHTGHVTAVAFSPDGRHIASAAWSITGGGVKLGADRPDPPKLNPGEVIIWAFDRDTGGAKPVQTIKAAHPAGTFCLAWSPDGKSLATGGGDSNARLPFDDVPAPDGGATAEAVRVWDAATGKRLAAFPCDAKRHVGALAWSPDGKTLAHTGFDRGGVRLLDATTGKERALLAAPTQALAFAPDGARLAAVGYGGKGSQGLVELWETATGKKLASEVRHEQGVNCVAFGPDGKTLLTGDSDGVLNLWDVNPPKR